MKKILLLFIFVLMLFGCESKEITVKTKQDGVTSTFITSIKPEARYYDYYISNDGNLYVDVCKFVEGEDNCVVSTHYINLNTKEVEYNVLVNDVIEGANLWVKAPNYEIYRKYISIADDSISNKVIYYYVSNNEVKVLFEYDSSLENSRYVDVEYDSLDEKTYVSYPLEDKCIVYEVLDGELIEVNNFELIKDEYVLNYISFHTMSAIYNSNFTKNGNTKIYSRENVYEFKNYDNEYLIGDYLFIYPININEQTCVINLQRNKEKTLDKTIPMSWHNWMVSDDYYSYIYYSNPNDEYMLMKFDGNKALITPLGFDKNCQFVQLDETKFVFISKDENNIHNIYLVEIKE